MNLSEEKSAEVSMALIEACINAFEHSETKEDIYIHFIISDENLTIKVIDKGVGFDASAIKLPNIDDKVGFYDENLTIKVIDKGSSVCQIESIGD